VVLRERDESRPRATSNDDHALVLRARRGDVAAFGTLIERHRDVALRVAGRIAGPRDAEDAVQDAFLRAFHRLETFRGEAPFRSWLLQIVHHAALTVAGRRRRTDREEPGVEEVISDADGSRLPAERLEHRERIERLQRKLGQLRPAHRAVVALRDIEGLSYEEIAMITETPLGSVKGRLHRGRNELIELLRANTYDWGIPG
jgi:RNA polymerase sigma-70 factor (ECF subfamily)